jgi:hypothetical protein
MKESGANKQELTKELLVYDTPEGIVECIGHKMWAAINSTHWRYRESAALAFLKYLESGLTFRYQLST